MKNTDGYTFTKQNATTTIARQDGTVIGSAFRMPGDRRWMVTAKDFRGNRLPLYFDTMALVIRYFEAKYEREREMTADRHEICPICGDMRKATARAASAHGRKHTCKLCRGRQDQHMPGCPAGDPAR